MERDAVTKILAQNIERLMLERNTNAPTLAERAKLNRTAIYDIIKQRSMSPKVQTVAAIARALNVPMSDMFLTHDQILMREEIHRKFEALAPDRQEALREIVDAWMLRGPEAR